MNRRQLLLSAAGAGLAVSGLAPAAGFAALPATDDELAYANFGQAAELLMKDFYARTVAAKLVTGGAAHEVARGGLNSAEHAAALAKLLTDAGQTAAVEEDFEFVWPDGTFADQKSAFTTALKIAETLRGVYLSAASEISIPSYRTLYASMASNVGQQVGFLRQRTGGRVIGVSFPPAVDIETANSVIEAYLG